MPTRKSRFASLLLGIAVATSCSAGEIEGQSSSPRLADTDGTWLVTSYSGPLGDLDAGSDTPVVLDLDTSIMAVEGTAGCGTFLGSFSIGRPGKDSYASFTIPGEAASECAESTRSIHSAAIAALEGTTTFQIDGQTLILSGPESSATLASAS